MTKPTEKKRSQSEVVSEVMLRRAALAYAAVANLDPSDPRWRRADPQLGQRFDACAARRPL